MRFSGAIGAMVIVLSLLLTIVAGAGLNVTTSAVSTVDYEYQTDISGLYNYSQSAEYLEYNPPANYTGYKLNRYTTTLYNDTSIGYSMLELQHGDSIKITGAGKIYIDTSFSNGISEGASALPSQSPYAGVLCEWGFIARINNVIKASFAPNLTYNMTSAGDYCTITYNNNSTIDIYYYNTNTTYNKSISGPLLYYAPNYNEHATYQMIRSAEEIDVYVGSVDDLVFYGYDPTQATRYCGYGNHQIDQWNAITKTFTTFDTVVTLDTSLYKVNTMSSFVSGSRTVSLYWTAYPIEVTDPRDADTGLGINYTQTNTANNYSISDPLYYESGTYTVTGMGTGASTRTHWNPTCNYYNGTDNYYFGSSSIDSTRYISLSTFMSNITYSASATKLKIDTVEGMDRFTGPIGSYAANYAYITGSYSGNDTITWENTYYYELKNTDKPYAIVDLSDNSVNVYSNNDLIGTGTTSNIYILYTTAHANHFVNWVAYTDVYHYMSINDGVSIDNTEQNYYTEWANGYAIGEIDILINTGGITADTHNRIMSLEDEIEIYTADTIGGSGVFITINGRTPVNIGIWNQFILIIDCANGLVYAQPCYMFVNYTQVTEISDPIYIGTITAMPVYTLYWGDTDNSMSFSVYDTKIDLGTKSLLMVNPSINLTEYWPNENYLKVNMYSFASYGTAITINNVTYTVTDGTITITEDGVSTTHALKNISISYESDTYLTFNNENKTYDLGTTASKTLSMTGAWYYTTDLYTGTLGTKNVISQSWSLDNLLQITDEQSIIFAGIAILGMLICTRFFKMGALDYILIIGAVAADLIMFIGW